LIENLKDFGRNGIGSERESGEDKKL